MRSGSSRRTSLGDLLGVADRVDPVFGRGWWDDFERCTEAARVRRTLGDEFHEEEAQQPRQRLLVVRPNLDLYGGTTGVYRRRHGNLRGDGAPSVLKRAFADGPTTREGVYFGALERVSTRELAGRRGDPAGAKVYSQRSLRWRWLDEEAPSA